MKKIVLKSITLDNFRSICKTINFNDGVTNIKGRNKSGKTSIINAWRWLLTGKVDAFHPANYELFDCTMPLTEHTPSAIVRATIEIDGVEYILERSAKPKFTLDKSTMEYVKSPSDKYTYKIDDIEYTATEFGEWITANIAPNEILPYVIDGSFFVEMVDSNKAKAMEALSHIVGEIKDSDFVGDYECLKEYLGKISEEAIVKHQKQIAKDLKESIDAIPTQKRLIQKMIEEKASCKYDENIEKELIEKINNCNERMLNRKKQFKDVEDREKLLHENLRNLGLKIHSNRETYTSTFEAEKREINSLIRNVSNSIEENGRVIAQLKAKKESLLMRISSLEVELDKARKNRDIRKIAMNSEKVVCPTCGCELKEGHPMFNSSKKELDEIVANGWRLRKEKDEAKEKLATIVDEIVLISNDKFEDELSLLKSKLQSLIDNHIEYEDTDDYKSLVAESNKIKNELSSIDTCDLSDILEEENALRERLKVVLEEKAIHKQRLELENSLKELNDEHREKGIQMAKSMKLLNSANARINERNEIASNRVNEKMRDCFLQMWKLQKDGSRTPDCIILDNDGVKYGSTNTAERMKINISLQELFMKHYEVVLPVFVDEASVFDSMNKPKMDGQCVFIYASDDNNIVVC